VKPKTETYAKNVTRHGIKKAESIGTTFSLHFPKPGGSSEALNKQ